MNKLVSTAALCAALAAPRFAQTAADPYLWLEDVAGDKALAWVRERNAVSEKKLEATPGFDELRRQVQAVLDSSAQIPYVKRQGEHLYNLWKDAAHPRGLWRRTTLAEYRKAEPAWDTVLDLDALAKAEGANWVWSGATCLAPEYRRCLLALSRGGADATVVREFDTSTKRFVEGGFTLPEAKTTVEWADADHLWVGTDFGPGSLTESGYARQIKRWARGTPLAAASTVYEGQAGDVGVGLEVDRTPGFERTLFARQVGFFTRRYALLQGGKPQPLDLPEDAVLQSAGPHLLLRLRGDWTVAGRSWPRGSLLVGDAAAVQRGERNFTSLFTPTTTRSLTALATTASAVLLTVSDNVASRLEEWKLADGRWSRREVDAPFPGTLMATSLHDATQKADPLADAYLLNVANFLQPDTLQLGRVGSDTRELLKSRPGFYDAAGMRVEQFFASSRDGTKVPYFVVWPRGAKALGDNPTLLTGYGGFQITQRPYYSPALGLGWLTRGGVLVVANIRGGGEFGPSWHQAAMKANKQRSYDDFVAVAEDLVARKITSPKRLGIQGGSNGGLLVGAVMVQRPDLFAAVVCQVPLLDMQRYHKLLAGASWMAEYGDPDKPEEWAYISRYSPYQNVKKEAAMPQVLFTTSTRDDRVHPGHARKMAARMLEQGHRVLYWENLEGGHAGAADSAQRARKAALEYAFLWQALGVAPTAP
jgi:prolyl oligopeptidase